MQRIGDAEVALLKRVYYFMHKKAPFPPGRVFTWFLGRELFRKGVKKGDNGVQFDRGVSFTWIETGKATDMALAADLGWQAIDAAGEGPGIIDRTSVISGQ